MNTPDGHSESASSPAPDAVPPIPVFDAVVVYNPAVIPAQPGPPPAETPAETPARSGPPAEQPGPPPAAIPAQPGPPPAESVPRSIPAQWRSPLASSAPIPDDYPFPRLPQFDSIPPSWYAPPPPPPRKRRGRTAVIVLAVFAALAAATAVAVYPVLTGRDADATAAPAVTGPPASPGPSALSYERVPWIRYQIDAALQAQAAALLAGDENGFLAPVAEGGTELTRDLRRRFETLRAMQVTAWSEEMIGAPTPVTGKGGRDEWRVVVDLRHCFVVPECTVDGLRAETRWVETPAQGLRMVAFAPSEAEENGPRPWEVTNLTVSVGARTVVGVTPKYARRLPELQKQAEAAALLADRYVRGDAGPVDRYRIFMADGKEWQRWYGGEDLEWAAGFAVPTGEARLDVVLNLSEMPEDFIDDTLRHELAHVATLRGADYSDDDDSWWMIEGIADYVDELGVPVSEYDEADLVARYAGEVDMKDGVVVPPPDADTEDWQVAARYGVGYYAVRRISERFGEPAMLAFFDAVVRDGKTLKDAAPATLGKDWDDVNRDCLAYLEEVT
ncbi:hypothetical protein J2S43_006513 [Catenuloplanes nepalensis]|uniref:Peptidase MA-like domain-containing protein n=1 Tax=Catenuloplanes nepalensis TaxID=587533 RepID=A0ABT9N3K1_9ACTN|nr:hypothetical protein [Catenuloplanes nepalensis]MDP9798001.1 hypothetical protein [Catenuloplanes nepalensis]